MSLPRPIPRLSVLSLAVLTSLAASVVVAGTASAHVSAASQDAAPGGYGKVIFRVPNESDAASTVSVRIQIPQEAALASLRTQPVPGWTATMTTADLDQPLESHGQEITSYVSIVEFRADAGAGVAPGQFQEFAFSGGPFPDIDAVTYPVIQGYSDGNEAAWIEPTIDGAEPEKPAPVLTLTANTAGGAAGGNASDGTTADGNTVGATSGHGHQVDSEPAGLALFVAILALMTAVAGVVVGVRANRRTVSS